MDYFGFLKADVLCLLHDYCKMSAQEIESILGLEDEEEADLDYVPYELVMEEKVKEGSIGNILIRFSRVRFVEVFTATIIFVIFHYNLRVNLLNLLIATLYWKIL